MLFAILLCGGLILGVENTSFTLLGRRFLLTNGGNLLFLCGCVTETPRRLQAAPLQGLE
jgi:hypothetical protein